MTLDMVVWLMMHAGTACVAGHSPRCVSVCSYAAPLVGEVEGSVLHSPGVSSG